MVIKRSYIPQVITLSRLCTHLVDLKVMSLKYLLCLELFVDEGHVPL